MSHCKTYTIQHKIKIVRFNSSIVYHQTQTPHHITTFSIPTYNEIFLDHSLKLSKQILCFCAHFHMSASPKFPMNRLHFYLQNQRSIQFNQID